MTNIVARLPRNEANDNEGVALAQTKFVKDSRVGSEAIGIKVGEFVISIVAYLLWTDIMNVTGGGCRLHSQMEKLFCLRILHARYLYRLLNLPQASLPHEQQMDLQRPIINPDYTSARSLVPKYPVASIYYKVCFPCFLFADGDIIKMIF